MRQVKKGNYKPIVTLIDLTGCHSSGHSLDLLIEVSSRNAELIVDSTLPLLFSTLPDRAPARDAHSERAKCWSTLNRLSRLCVSQPLFETLVIRLTTKLDLACDTGLTGSSTEDLEVTSAYAHAILKTLADTLEVKVSSKHSDIAKYMDRLLPRLFRLFIHLALHPAGVKIMNMRLLEIAGRVITLVVSCASVEYGIPTTLTTADWANWLTDDRLH